MTRLASRPTVTEPALATAGRSTRAGGAPPAPLGGTVGLGLGVGAGVSNGSVFGAEVDAVEPDLTTDVTAPPSPDHRPATLDYQPTPEHRAPSDDSAIDPPGTLRRRAVRGSIFTAGGHGASIVLRLGSNLILTRLLAPELFGLMGLVNIFLQGLTMFSDLGVGPSVIQNRRGEDPDFLRTAWTAQVARGVGLWVLSCAIAWPAAALYDQPALRWLIPLAAVNALLSGFNSTAMFRLGRHLQLGKLTLLSLGTQVIAITGMVIWASVSPSVLALLVPGLIATAVGVFASHRLLPGVPRDRFGWDRSAAHELLTFGKWIFLSTLLAFGTNQADRLVLGKMIPLDLLGVYGIGMLLATMPAQIILKLGQSVAFPAYSRVKDQPKRFAAAVQRVRLPLLLVGAFAVTGLVSGGQAMIDVLYDQRYVDAGWVVQAIAAGVWFQILGSTNGSVLLARGESRWLAVAQGFKLAGMVGLMLLGYQYGLPLGGPLAPLAISAGFPGAVAGVAASEVIGYVVSALAVRRMRLGVKLIRFDLLLTVAVLATSYAAWWLGREFGAGTPLAATLAVRLGKHGPPLVELAAIGAFATAFWLPLTAWQWRRLRGDKPGAPKVAVAASPPV